MIQSQKKNQFQVPSHIDIHEECSCTSNLSIPTLTLPTIKPNKVEQFLKQISNPKHSARRQILFIT